MIAIIIINIHHHHQHRHHRHHPHHHHHHHHHHASSCIIMHHHASSSSSSSPPPCIMHHASCIIIHRLILHQFILHVSFAALLFYRHAAGVVKTDRSHWQRLSPPHCNSVRLIGISTRTLERFRSLMCDSYKELAYHIPVNIWIQYIHIHTHLPGPKWPRVFVSHFFPFQGSNPGKLGLDIGNHAKQ